MRKWILVGTATALLAISGGAAFASWGGGTGSDAVSVEGTVSLADTKYWIDGDLTPLCDPNIVCNVTAVEDGTWLLDFGARNYYLSNPGSCDLSNFPAPNHTIDGKLAQQGEIDVYRVDGCDLRSGEEGGSPPWSEGVDSDNDGFEDLVEASIGTDPVDDCADDPTDDAWPPDLASLGGYGTHDGKSDIYDIVELTPPYFGQCAGDLYYDNRKDFSGLFYVPDDCIDIFDIDLLTQPVFGSICTP